MIPSLGLRVAAANSMSDVFAMGGRPLAGINLVSYPLSQLGGDALKEILRGGLSAMAEAGAVLAGGHTVEGQELLYGLAVDADGNVYVADSGNHRIQKFTRKGAFLDQWGGSGPGSGPTRSNCPSDRAMAASSCHRKRAMIPSSREAGPR